MSTLDYCIVMWALGFLAGACAGYGVPRLYRRAVDKAVERERVVTALAGDQVPPWEQVAREIERAAVVQAHQGLPATARNLLEQAADVRRRAGR